MWRREVQRSTRDCTCRRSHSEPFFDFCIGINGQPLTDLGVEFPPGVPIGRRMGHASWGMVEANEGREIVLNVWSSKQQAYRGTHWP